MRRDDGEGKGVPRMEAPSPRTAGWALGMILALTLGLRSIALDQPLVENYVGRQIPTAMVARNLERGSGFFHPALDVAPFPNLFLVEPPIYAGVAGLVRHVSGLELGAAGRLTSALGIVLAAWGLYGLVVRREDANVALVADDRVCLLPGHHPLRPSVPARCADDRLPRRGDAVLG